VWTGFIWVRWTLSKHFLLNLRIPQKARNFLASSANISFSGMTALGSYFISFGWLHSLQ
jgi:hypothetical protein